jgi:hypothetical protein
VVIPPSTESDEMRVQNFLATYSGVTVFKLHGTFDDLSNFDNSHSIVITENDYIDFMNRGGIGGGGIPTLIRSQFVSSIALLLGYSARDWDFRMFYRAFPKKVRPKIFAVMKDPSRLWTHYLEAQGITILNTDIYEFAEMLEEGYKKFIP